MFLVWYMNIFLPEPDTGEEGMRGLPHTVVLERIPWGNWQKLCLIDKEIKSFYIK